ncbi:MAG: hypothetical protein GBAus27B_000555 [Mycoplasmataceae bacterium]|nr:MAG: hypothetical protein GBAus27B_000555 [Mycoplasmataceae bacterium]
MENKSINVYFNKQDYETIKTFIPKGKISSLASSLLIEYINKEKQKLEKKAVEGYQFYKSDKEFKKVAIELESASFTDACQALEKKDGKN